MKGPGYLNDHERPIKALSEIALRAKNLKAMQEFYENVLGLELFEGFDDIIFFRIAPGLNAPSQLLVLVDASSASDHKTRQYSGLDIQKTTLHHFAFAISQSDFQSEYDRLLGLGLNVEKRVHERVHYRSLYVCDPDSNVIELVCYDESI